MSTTTIEDLHRRVDEERGDHAATTEELERQRERADAADHHVARRAGREGRKRLPAEDQQNADRPDGQ